MHNGRDHYDPLLGCPDRPLRFSHKSKGGDVITDRLNGTVPTTVVAHLLELSLVAFLVHDVSTNLYTVC